MTCRGICSRYRAVKRQHSSRYLSGHKRCTQCEIFVNWEGVNCPCCGSLLRTKPRGTQGRQKMVAVLQNKN